MAIAAKSRPSPAPVLNGRGVDGAALYVGVSLSSGSDRNIGVLPGLRRRRAIGDQQAARPIIFRRNFGNHHLHGSRRLPQPLDKRLGHVGDDGRLLLTGGVSGQTDIDKGHVALGFLTLEPMGARGHDDLIALLFAQAIFGQHATLVFGGFAAAAALIDALLGDQFVGSKVG